MDPDNCPVAQRLAPFIDELTGFVAYVALFGGLSLSFLTDQLINAGLKGFSMAGSTLCLYYLITNWKPATNHYIITTFSVILTSFNIVALVFKAISVKLHIISVQCFPDAQSQTDIPFQLSFDHLTSNVVLSILFLPLFLWISDAFLVSDLHPSWLHG